MPHKAKEARLEYLRAWTAKRRQDWIDSQGGCCAFCGTTQQLEVDHIDPTTKLMNPGQVWTRNSTVREAELAKCQVLCASCHKIKTSSQRNWTHGESGYQHKCRCEKCVSAHNEAKRDYRQKKRDQGLPYK